MIRLQCEEQNQIAHLDRFLHSWDATAGQDVSITPDVHAPRSEFGNINVGARPWTAPSLLLPRGHADFYTHVEPGVRPWVRWFVANGYTTYTSCEGHDYGPGKDPDMRHVGVLLRTECERESLLVTYQSVNLTDFMACELAYLEHFVESDGARHDALDLFMVPRSGATWADYFAVVDQVTTSMLSQLQPK